MQAEQGRGLKVLKQLAHDALNRLPRDEARSFIDAMSADEFADALVAVSAAGVAADGETGGNLFYESAATRIRAAFARIDQLERGPKPFPQPLTNTELMEAQGLKAPEVVYGSPPCKMFSRTVTGGRSVTDDPAYRAAATIDLSSVKERFLKVSMTDGVTIFEATDTPPMNSPAVQLPQLSHRAKRSTASRPSTKRKAARR